MDMSITAAIIISYKSGYWKWIHAKTRIESQVGKIHTDVSLPVVHPCKTKNIFPLWFKWINIFEDLLEKSTVIRIYPSNSFLMQIYANTKIDFQKHRGCSMNPICELPTENQMNECSCIHNLCELKISKRRWTVFWSIKRCKDVRIPVRILTGTK